MWESDFGDLIDLVLCELGWVSMAYGPAAGLHDARKPSDVQSVAWPAARRWRGGQLCMAETHALPCRADQGMPR